MQTKHQANIPLTGLVLAALVTAQASAYPLTCRIETDRSVLPAGTEGQAVLKITLTARETAPERERTPVNLAIVLDRSGSMSGSKIMHAREAALDALRRLHPEDIVSLVTYDSTVETVIPAQSPRNLEWMEEQVRRITPRGMTALFGGVSQGAAELRKHQDGRYIHRMILLSDGLANVGPSQPADLARLGAALLKERIGVSTIGVGLGYNEDLMTGLARESGGNTYFVEDSADLARILTAELGSAQQTVARRVIVEIELPEGVTPVRVIGREGRVSSRRIEVPLYDLQAGQSRYALVEVRVAPQQPEHVLKLARAHAAYEDPVRQRRTATPAHTVEVTFSANPHRVETSINTAVENEVLRNLQAEAQEAAVQLADEGRRPEAAAVLREVAADYDRVARRRGDSALGEDALRITREAESLETRGLDNRQRKLYRAQSHQVTRQQETP